MPGASGLGEAPRGRDVLTPPSSPMHVGFVGTGNMGAPMARNILTKGHALTVS